MKKAWILFLLCVAVRTVSAQKIFWSDLTRQDVQQAVEESRSLFSKVEIGNREVLAKYPTEDSIYVGEQSWFSRDLFLDMLVERTQEISLQNIQLTGYRFDDFLEQYNQNEILEKVYPIFDNHSVLIRMSYQNNRIQERVIMVMIKKRDQWTITGFHGFGIFPETPPGEDFPMKKYRMEKIMEAGITFPVPADFSEADKSENQVNFYLEGETERDAVFQVLIDEFKAKVYYYTYKFVEFSNQQYELSELVVRYLPFGILFEYTVTDPYGTRNKGITVGLKSDNKMVVIQFYAFYDIFQLRKGEIMPVFDHIGRLGY